MKFASSQIDIEESNVVAFGVPIGKNSIKSLEALRYASQFVEPMDLDAGVNLLENVRISDLGNLEMDSLEEITRKTEHILAMDKFPLILGGNHLLSYYSLKAFNNIKLIVFDAHGDFKNSYEDEKIRDMDAVDNIDYNSKINDATWLRRVSEYINPENIALVGVRSCDEFEFKDLKKSGIKFFTSNDMKTNIDQASKFIEQFTKGSRVYISMDVDVFDPSICPSVDMPEPDGIFFNEFKKAVNSIKGDIVGLDACCLKSSSNSEISEFLVTRSIFQVLGSIRPIEL